MTNENKAKHLLAGSNCTNCIYCGYKPDKDNCILSQSSISENRTFIHDKLCSLYLSSKLIQNKDFNDNVYTKVKSFGNLDNVVAKMETYRGIS